jgi:hypothetical protein
VTADEFRDLALELDGASEGAHMGHPDFRVNNRIFASLRQHETLGMVKLSPPQQREFRREHPGMFRPSPGVWGRQGCTDVLLAKARLHAVRTAMLLAWEAAVSEPPPKVLRRSKPSDR